MNLKTALEHNYGKIKLLKSFQSFIKASKQSYQRNINSNITVWGHN